jgi:alpha-L-fucosidase
MARTIFFLLTLLTIFACTPKSGTSEKSEETKQQDAKMEWWRDARFGMFIHWGLYSVPAGEWEGREIPGISEWIMLRAGIPVKDYEQLAENFNPVKFDAEKWVLLAKNAGMKYIVITSKHHDGFAMFHSKASPYNIYDATPFKRDPLKELSDACKKHNIRLGFYYSQAQDWHEPGGTYSGIEKGTPHWDPTLKHDSLMNYIQQKALPQVKEILENYGGLDILWWDTPIAMTEEAAKLLQHEVDKYPNLITNNRLYRPWPGDFSTPEQYVPPTGLDYDWEVCMTMNTSWGYKWYDNNWKSAESLIHMLVDIASKGGNLLLNVGPTAEGIIPDSSAVRLEQIGNWMKQNGESVYGTSASPFFKLPWGRCTQRQENGNTILYLHVLNWPKDQVLKIPGLKAKIQDVYLLTNPKQKFAWKFENGNVLIHAPSVIFDPINTVIVVKTKGYLKITSNMPTLKDGKIELPAEFSDIHNPGYGIHAVLHGSGDKAVIKNWSDSRVQVEWMFNVSEPGIYKIESLMKTKAICGINIGVGEQNIKTEIQPSDDKFEVVLLGQIQISEPGNKVLNITPVKENWDEIEIKKIILSK